MIGIGQQRSSPAHTAGHTTRHSLGAEKMTTVTTNKIDQLKSQFSLTDYECDILNKVVDQADQAALVVTKSVAKNGMNTFYKVGFILNGRILNITKLISKITSFKINKDCNLVVKACGTCPDYTLSNGIYRALINGSSTQTFNYDVF